MNELFDSLKVYYSNDSNAESSCTKFPFVKVEKSRTQIKYDLNHKRKKDILKRIS